ncbi:MAG: amidase [Burkholderiaceae bacterium]|nr:amidase [Burkholderiaceae bacterium]
MNLAHASLEEVATLVRERRASAREVALATIAEVERVNPAINALIGFDAQAVLDEADAIDRRLARDADALRLPGVQVSVKDNLWVRGRRVTQGSALFADFVAPEDALAVARAREAGAAVLGISNCSEFACKGVTTNRVHGTTRNPWDLGRTPGGSSGGAAAAVAAGLGQAALCTDGGGSTRRPAAHAGVVGFKPSAGAIAHPVGFAEPVFGNSVVGLMARRVADVAMLFDAIAGSDPRDPLCMPGLPVESARAGLGRSLRGVRVAFSPRLGLPVPVDEAVSHAMEQAARWLADAGAELVPADPPWPAGAGEDALMPLQFGGLVALYGETWRRDPSRFDPDIGAQIERGLALGAADVARALAYREDLYRALAGFFSAHPLALSPTTPCVAWPLGELGPSHIEGQAVAPRAHAVFTPAFNHVYAPACSVPVGLDPQGLPIGAQLIGWRGQDALVLRAAAALEAAAPAVFRQPVSVQAGPAGA